MAKNDLQYGGWNSYTLQCGTIMTLISPGVCTLQCGLWLWNRDSEFTKWQHPAMWQVAVWWHATEFAQTKPKKYWNSTFNFDVDHITAVDMSFCTSLRNFIQIGPPSAEENKKLSYRWQTMGYRWQTVRCSFVKLLRYGRTFCQNT